MAVDSSGLLVSVFRRADRRAFRLMRLPTQRELLPRSDWFLRGTVGPYETDHEQRSLSVAGTTRIADRHGNSLQPARYAGNGSGSIPVGHELLKIYDPLLHHLCLNRLVTTLCGDQPQ